METTAPAARIRLAFGGSDFYGKSFLAFGTSIAQPVLRPVRLVVEHNGYFWAVSPLSGSLLRYRDPPRASLFDRRPAIVKEALSFVDSPFSCRSPWPELQLDIDDSIFSRLQKMHSRLRLIGNRKFFLSLVYASMSRPVFATTREAMAVITSIPDQCAHRESLCLQRTLLAAKVSRSFAEDGVIFVGANIDTGDMHAWIIEDGEQPDTNDRTWVNYRPLLALVGASQ